MDGSEQRLTARHTRAWQMLTGALAVHVADEAATDFLGFYNPLIEQIRSEFSWLLLPTFTFTAWITGLGVLVGLLLLMSGPVRRGAPGTTAASWILSGILFMNGVGHLAGSVYFHSWLPGATSAPLLLITSASLAASTWNRQRAARGGTVQRV